MNKTMYLRKDRTYGTAFDFYVFDAVRDITVVAEFNKDIVHLGLAFTHPTDKFNKKIGRELASQKLLTQKSVYEKYPLDPVKFTEVGASVTLSHFNKIMNDNFNKAFAMFNYGITRKNIEFSNITCNFLEYDSSFVIIAVLDMMYNPVNEHEHEHECCADCSNCACSNKVH